jgi:hypothetical protein
MDRSTRGAAPLNVGWYYMKTSADLPDFLPLDDELGRTLGRSRRAEARPTARIDDLLDRISRERSLVG